MTNSANIYECFSGKKSKEEKCEFHWTWKGRKLMNCMTFRKLSYKLVHGNPQNIYVQITIV